MTNCELELLDGINQNYVLKRLKAAGGKEIESGKFSSPESSASLAVNCFAWFNERPEQFPNLPKIELQSQPIIVEIEYSARFPWKGGRHPWLDAFIETECEIVGVESKRFEPFRDTKSVNLSKAYWREVWGKNMKGFENVRDKLAVGEIKFKYLDAAQLIKHAFGLVTEGNRKGKRPILYYLFAEPANLRRNLIPASAFSLHRAEAKLFHDAVIGDEVEFAYCSYQEWLSRFDGNAKLHADNVIEKFNP